LCVCCSVEECNTQYLIIWNPNIVLGCASNPDEEPASPSESIVEVWIRIQTKASGKRVRSASGAYRTFVMMPLHISSFERNGCLLLGLKRLAELVRLLSVTCL
jgi:hypothetical protein